MFEGYARNKYNSTGVIQWMLNNAWPSTHLAPLRLLHAPGRRLLRHQERVRAAARPVSYDDRSIALVNDTPAAVPASRSRHRCSTSGSRRGFRARPASIFQPTASFVPSRFPIAGLTTTYFLRLSARDTSAAVISTNFYWLSTQA